MTLSPRSAPPRHEAPPPHARTLRALAWLLRYPDDALRAIAPQLAAALHEHAALPTPRLAELDALAARLAAAPALRAEAEYVELFDRGRRTALHLFEHVHGDSRDRGQAMVDLAQTYERAGVHLAPGELPDYLPVVLEFASTQPAAVAREFVREITHVVRAIMSALAERKSPYASVLAAVLELAGERADPVTVPAEPSLDATWEEPAAFDGCPSRAPSGAPQPVHFVRPAAARAAA